MRATMSELKEHLIEIFDNNEIAQYAGHKVPIGSPIWAKCDDSLDIMSGWFGGLVHTYWYDDMPFSLNDEEKDKTWKIWSE